MSNINESDEELARRLQNEENQRSRQPSSSYNMSMSYIPPSPTSMSIPNVQIQKPARIGEKLIIKLHHPYTNNVIGEVMYVIYESPSVVVFELVSAPGRRLRVCINGSVEFSYINDDSVRFQVELISNGATFLLNKANTAKSNSLQEIGWYLSLTREGVLRGNGGKNKDSQWILHGVETAQPRYIPPRIPQHNNTIQTKSTVVTTGTVVSSPNTSSTKISVNDAAIISSDPSKLVNFNASIQWQWLESPNGQEYLLSISQHAMSMFQDGSLRRYLYRPDWPNLTTRFYDMPRKLPIFNIEESEKYFSLHDQKEFFTNGFVILSNIIPLSLIDNASKLIHFYYHSQINTVPSTLIKSYYTLSSVEFNGDIKSDVDLLALFNCTALTQIVQKLLGKNEFTLPDIATTIVYSPTLMQPSQLKIDGKTWFIEGFTNTGDFSPYTLLIGIPLSDMIEPFCGNMCVHPRSHITLMESIKGEIEKKSTLFSSLQHREKPDIGNPVQILMQKGDCFLCTAKCAIQNAANCCSKLTEIVYFKISHIDHNVMKTVALESVWVEFPSYAE